MEFVIIVGFSGLFNETVELCDCPAVKLKHFFSFDAIGIGIEVGKISKTISGGVAELQIVLRELLENLFAAADINMIICRSGPETYKISTEFIAELVRINTVAERLMHCAAFAVNSPAMSDALLVRSAFSKSAYCDKK